MRKHLHDLAAIAAILSFALTVFTLANPDTPTEPAPRPLYAAR